MKAHPALFEGEGEAGGGEGEGGAKKIEEQHFYSTLLFQSTFTFTFKTKL